MSLLLVSLTASVSVAAEPTGRTAFRAYAADDGLTNLVTRHLAQDRLRFVWVGTDDGLFRFDGERFVRFGLEDGLPSTRVTGLLAAPDGRLWMASRAGLAVLPIVDATRPLPNRFTTVPPADGPRGVILALAASPVDPASPAGKSKLWVGTSEGLFAEEPVGSGRFASVARVPAGDVTALWVDADGAVQLGRGPTLFTLAAQGAPTEQKSVGDRIDRIVRDRLGRLWLRTPNTLWAQASPGAPFVDHSKQLPAISTNGYLALDSRGDPWAMTNRGLLQIDGERFVRLPPGLPTDWSWSFLEDHEGSRWIGSTGLNRELGRGLFRSYGRPEGLPSEIFWELRRDRDGGLLVATDEGLAKIGEAGVTRFAGTEKHTIRAVVIAPDGTYYAAGSPAEILHLQPGGRVEKIGAAAGLRGKTIMALHLDTKGKLWIASDGGGLQSLQLGGPPRVVPEALPGGSPTELINDLRADAKGRLWVAGEAGLALFDGDNPLRFVGRDGLLGTGTNTILHRQNGEVCVSYFDSIGLSCFREAEGRLTVVKHLDQERGLSSSRVYSLGEDAAGRLWVGTGAGADVISELGVEHFGKSDGMPGDDCDSRSFLAEANGTVWLGTSTGLARFEGARYAGPPTPPVTTALAVTVGTRSLRAPPLRLTAEEHTLGLLLAANSYVHERRTRFDTRLVGFDDWHASAMREVRYAALPPGTYRFEARARVDQGAWGPVLSLPVIVEPRWYQTWLARGAAALLAAGLIGLFVGWRVRRLRVRNVELEGMVKARTAELATANRALTDLSLTDPLTGLRNRRYLASTIPTDVAQVQRTYRDLSSGRSDRLPRNVDLVFLLVDLDHFKQVNDRYGHTAGDRVLQELRQLLIGACRTSDIVVRWGGEEFLIVARNSSREEATILAERVRTSIAAHLFEVGIEEPISMTCSVGFAAFPFVPRRPDAASWEEVIDLADRCLYIAKREGRNRWVGVRSIEETLEVPEERAWLSKQFDGLLAKGDLELLRSIPGKPSA